MVEGGKQKALVKEEGGESQRDGNGGADRRAFLENCLSLRVMPSCESPGTSDSEEHLDRSVYGSSSLGRDHRHPQEVLVFANC